MNTYTILTEMILKFKNTYTQVTKNLPDGWKAHLDTRCGACPTKSSMGSSLIIINK